MKFSTRSRYGLRAMVYLAMKGRPTRGEKVAKHEGISKKYLDAILTRLREAKLVKTLRGPGGGYGLSRPPEEISVEEVVKALEGGLLIVPCLDETYNCGKMEACPTRKVWEAVSSVIENTLSGFTLADLLAGQDVKNISVDTPRDKNNPLEHQEDGKQ